MATHAVFTATKIICGGTRLGAAVCGTQFCSSDAENISDMLPLFYVLAC